MEVNITMMEGEGEMIEVTPEIEIAEDTTEIREMIGEISAEIEIEIGVMTDIGVEDDLEKFVNITVIKVCSVNVTFFVFDIPKSDELQSILDCLNVWNK